MSHTTVVKDVRVHDLNHLRTAVENLNTSQSLGLTYEDGGMVNLWSTKRNVAANVRVPGTRFNVGFAAAEDGNGYVPVFDAHGGEIYRVLGQGREIAQTAEERNLSNIGKLMQAHTLAALTSAAMMQGATVSMSEPVAGQYVLQVA